MTCSSRRLWFVEVSHIRQYAEYALSSWLISVNINPMGSGGLTKLASAFAGLAAAALLGAAAFAGAWPMEPGGVQAISSVSYDVADRLFADDGEAGEAQSFSKAESSIFVEWGATERLTLIAQPVVQSVDIRVEGGEPDVQSGFASSQIGARWLLGQSALGVASVQGALIAPGRVENVLNQPLGEGGAAAEARLLAGRGWNGGFAEAQAGYRWRGGGDIDELRFDATIGLRPGDGWMLMAQSFSIYGEDSEIGRPNESHKAQFSVVRNLTETLAVQVGARGSYAGRNVVEERGAFVSLWVRH